MGPKPLDPEVRFWRRVEKTDGCWLWTASRAGGQTSGSGGRYGNFVVPRGPLKGQYAHRFSYLIHHGEIPAGLVVCHRCDNPICVNPAHLYLGTMAVNNADMRAKGRHAFGDRHGLRKHPERTARGERQGSARLTAAQVWEMRKLRQSGLTQQAIADRFGVSREHVRDIINGKRWSHLAFS